MRGEMKNDRLLLDGHRHSRAGYGDGLIITERKIMYKLSWTNSQGKKCVRQFKTNEERVLFADTLYVNEYDKYGKISMSRPTQRLLDAAKAWAFK
jgi:hypothetical protein